MATHNQCIADEYHDVDDNWSGAFSLNSDFYEVEHVVADAVGRGIAWNREVIAVGPHGSLTKIPLASHDGFHDCKQFLNNGSDMYMEDGTDSYNLEEVALDGAEEHSTSLFDAPDSLVHGMDATTDCDIGGSGTLGGSAVMSSFTNLVSGMFPKTDNSDDLRNELQRSAGLSSNQEQNHSSLLEAIVHDNETIIRAADNLHASGGKATSATKAAR